MTNIRPLIKVHPLLTYFALAFTPAFAISCGGVLIEVGPGSFPVTPKQFEKLFPYAVLAMIVGPSVAGILLTGLVYGREGFRDLRARMTRLQVDVRWYVVALLTAPLWATVVLLALSVLSP
jgi:hypothetical protein